MEAERQERKIPPSLYKSSLAIISFLTRPRMSLRRFYRGGDEAGAKTSDRRARRACYPPGRFNNGKDITVDSPVLSIDI